MKNAPAAGCRPRRCANVSPPTSHRHARDPDVDVKYGDAFRQTFDLWLADSKTPTPLVFYLHGGGWGAQDKTDIHQHLEVRALLDAGISVASVNYRFLVDANAAKISPPLQWPLQDAARALQFVRSKSAEWNLDKTRIAASGVSAGGCSSLWLAMHDDMADPASKDPVARESTRLLFTVTKAPSPRSIPRNSSSGSRTASMEVMPSVMSARHGPRPSLLS
jgi:acetyl esterase/lipase